MRKEGDDMSRDVLRRISKLAGLLVIVVFLAGCYGEGVLVVDGPFYSTFLAEALDEGDGYLFTDDGTAVRFDGIYVEDGYTEGYMTFSLAGLPSWAWVEDATLYLGVVGVYPDSPPVEISMERVGFSIPLDSSALWEPGDYYGRFRLYAYDTGNYVVLDVTDMVRDAVSEGDFYLQLRFSAFYGGVDLEDGGNNLGSHLVPRLEVTYY